MSTYNQLSEQERYTITAGLISRNSMTEIAEAMGRSRSTLYRELSRNRTNHDDGYRALIAHSYATARRRRNRRGSQYSSEQWKEIVILLEQKLSPEQIAATIKGRGQFSISHETIYKYILADKKKGGSLYKNLRIKPKRHRKRGARHQNRGILPEKRNISTRPASAESRKSIGHWEGDTVIGADRHHCIVTLVERKTGFVVIVKVKAKTVAEINRACFKALRKHGRKIKTITFDNGPEFHGYKLIESKFPVICYFANPYHSWERGSNENLNGLIRQYLPKGTCMRSLGQPHCDRIANQLNSRPRKRHGFKTPKELFYGI